MRWRLGRRSSNIEDRRGAGGFGRGMRVPIRLPFPGSRRGGVRRAGGLGIGGILIILVVSWFLGIDPSMFLGGTGTMVEVPVTTRSAPTSAEEEELKEFVARVLGDTEDTFERLFAERGGDYQEPTLVLFTGAVQSACGFQKAAIGPFYCPGDSKVYLDLGFFHELRQRFQAPGDFARAYVIAHEVGHHIQNLLGISREVQAARQQMSQAEGNELSVRLELQADCLAGVWAHHAENRRDLLEEGDLEEGLTAASAIGDDTIQKRSQGYVVPESFTHGSAEQRVRWFETGFEEGSLQAC
ncbi:MAG: neutral zinc metallopeptidase, partial [Geminicoccaceae bacterium]|nr:neutral zinc metallopeptidase [Geminicoccaceae bacterium]